MDVNSVPEALTGLDWATIWPAIIGTGLSVVVTAVLFVVKNDIDREIRLWTLISLA